MKTALPETFSLDALPGVRQIICLDETVSTQNVARELAEEGAPERTLVLAETQTGGRGQHDRAWDSGPGGLYMTLLLRPETGLQFLPHLSELSGEVVAETLGSLYGIKTRVKKPNDVYAWHPRRRKWLKIAGILNESLSKAGTPDWLLLGLGVNLVNKPSLDTAVSVKAITGRAACRGEFLAEFFGIFWRRYAAWEHSSLAQS